METIFDHNPTKEELKRFGFREYETFSIQEQKDFYLNHPSVDTYNYHLYILFSIRGNDERAKELYQKLSSDYKGLLMQDF